MQLPVKRCDWGALREGQERKARREPEASEDLQRMARPDRREGHALLSSCSRPAAGVSGRL
ncbi:MAG: hypothetical protein LBU37_15505 [Tannerellaceae bacterium]|nr:hypothetical protein [Tannerellaceae bacterium]